MAALYLQTSFIIICIICRVVSSAATPLPLRFKRNGKFKILQVADMHYADGKSTKCLDVLPSQYPSCSDLNTTAFVNRMIEAEKPDLVVFTGDNIFGLDTTNAAASIKAAFGAAVAAKLPWAAVLGNHDQESATLNREGVMKHIVSMDYTLSKLNPKTNKKIDGFGNYNLEVMGVAGSALKGKSVLNLYFVDSGDYSTDPNISGYGWIKPSQQAWFKETSAKLRENYTNTPLAQSEPAPGLAYFHIPLPEVNELDSSNITGIKQEDVSCPSYNSGFMETMVEAGDVKAAFTGHDHLNDFCGKVQGIELCYAGGFGYHAYGKAGWARRSRVVLASLEKDSYGGWKGVKSITTWKRLDDKLLTKIDVQTLWTKPMDKESLFKIQNLRIDRAIFNVS
ncbi:probable inactive purple acid phosphatase 29 isoform X1 [Cryptomeria japonica]|uniref:probable inactive purple acid phosphatase 29 isoform X1 n=1 Tax=Cryptomeria japonica TaxID=3369 RepID=UPI0027DA20AF|nr:probable inactive purple acid phosphatase 29 isoform X1 [Cryptomeria japonica]